MHLLFVLLFATIAFVGVAEEPCWAQVITVPRRSELADFPREQRRELELLANAPLEEALDRKYFTSGQRIDFNQPPIRFIREWNAWVEKRIENRNLQNSEHFVDAAEVIQRNKAEDAWEELCKQQNEEIKRWKQVKKTGARLFR